MGLLGRAGRGNPERSSHQVQAIGWVFNVGYLMLAFAVPLYAAHQHLPIWSIALLTALPGVFLVLQRILSGPLTAVFGEVRILRLSLLLAIAAGLAPFLGYADLIGLIAAQVLSGAMRGIFWTSAQSYITRLPGDIATRLGHFTGGANLGGLIGIVATGPLIGLVGYRTVFGLVTILQSLALLLTIGLVSLTASQRRDGVFPAIRRLPSLFRYSTMWIAGGIAILAAIPQALVQSFYPLYLLHLTHSASEASFLTALRNVGTILGSFLAGRLLRWTGHRAGVLLGVAGLAGGLILTGAASTAWLVAGALLATGFLSAPVAVLYLTLVVGAVPDHERASAMAVVNVFWSAAMLLVPLFFGLASQLAGMAGAFACLGAAVALALIPLSRSAMWATVTAERMGPAAPSAGA